MRLERRQPLLGDPPGQLPPAGVAAEQRGAELVLATLILVRPGSLGPASRNPDPDRIALGAHQAHPVQGYASTRRPHIHPADQGRVGRQRGLDLVQRRPSCR